MSNETMQFAALVSELSRCRAELNMLKQAHNHLVGKVGQDLTQMSSAVRQMKAGWDALAAQVAQLSGAVPRQAPQGVPPQPPAAYAPPQHVAVPPPAAAAPPPATGSPFDPTGWDDDEEDAEITG